MSEKFGKEGNSKRGTPPKVRPPHIFFGRGGYRDRQISTKKTKKREREKMGKKGSNIKKTRKQKELGHFFFSRLKKTEIFGKKHGNFQKGGEPPKPPPPHAPKHFSNLGDPPPKKKKRTRKKSDHPKKKKKKKIILEKIIKHE